MSVKLLWKAKLQHWKQEIRLKKMLRSLNRLAKKSSVSPSTSPRHSPFSSPLHSPKTSPASSPRRGSVVSGCWCVGAVAFDVDAVVAGFTGSVSAQAKVRHQF